MTNKVAKDLVEETDFNALEEKVTDNKIEHDNLQIKVTNNHLTTESSINNLKNKINNIDLTKYVLKSDFDIKVGNLELKIPDISGFYQTVHLIVKLVNWKIKSKLLKVNLILAILLIKQN